MRSSALIHGLRSNIRMLLQRFLNPCIGDRKGMNKALPAVTLALTVSSLVAAPAADRSRQSSAGLNGTPTRVARTLLISIDGMHALDLTKFIEMHPDSTLAELSRRGIIYSNAHTPIADSTPGMLALVTGGTPNSTGVYYSDGYDRTLSPPNSDCSTRGAAVVFDETADKNPDAEDAGGGIDPAKMARDPQRACAPVYPHDFLRVNTIFEVVKQNGGRTAWSDRHPTYGDFL